MEELNLISDREDHFHFAVLRMLTFTQRSVLPNPDFGASLRNLKSLGLFADIKRIKSRKARLNDSQWQFLLHVLQCFSQAWRGRWSEDTRKIVAQAMNENFPDSNFTIQELMEHEQNLTRRRCLEISGGLSGTPMKNRPIYAMLVAVYKGLHLGAEVETKSATTQIGTSADAAYNAQGITNRLCSSLSPPKEEGSMNNLNSSSTVPQSAMSGNLQVQPVYCHSFKLSSPNISPCGVSCVNNCENKSIANNDSDIGRNHSLSAQLKPDPASNYQQPHKHDSFCRNKSKRKFRGKPNCKKLRAANTDFSTKRCIKVFKKLPGFKEYHMDHVLEIFSDELYREAFISMKKSHKVFWLRSKLDKKE